MKALITGASSGIGREMARLLAKQNVELILTARRSDRLEELQQELSVPTTILIHDLSLNKECIKLYEEVKPHNIDILINAAGFGIFGNFNNTKLSTELSMLNTNIDALHILTKLFLADFIQKDSGYILNIASSAAFLPGPLLSSYYASKAYVMRLTCAISEELHQNKSKVSVSVLCPGPVDTEFNQVAQVKFALKGLSSTYVAQYALDKMFKHKLIIIPGIQMKFANFFCKILPTKILLKCAYYFQSKKAD